MSCCSETASSPSNIIRTLSELHYTDQPGAETERYAPCVTSSVCGDLQTPRKLFSLPATYGIDVSIELIGTTEPSSCDNYREERREKDETVGYMYFDPICSQHVPFDEPVASFMQDSGIIIVMCRVRPNDPLELFVAVQYELLNKNAQRWVVRWLHPENPDGGGQLYKISKRTQYWRVQHIMEVIGSKVKLRYFGGHVAIVPRTYLHDEMQPLVECLAGRYQCGDYRPV